MVAAAPVLHLPLPSSDEAQATPIDLTPADYDAPAVARSGGQPYAPSPDGRELVYVQNRDKDLALGTNNDLFLCRPSTPMASRAVRRAT